MAKKTYEHRLGSDGRVKVVGTSLPRGMRGVDPEWDVHTFTEGPLTRLLSRLYR
jgi:hypothetical protein